MDRLILGSIISCFFSFSLAATRVEFDRAYEKYQQLVEQNETQQAVKAAEHAWQLGADVYGMESVNMANLAVNYAMLLRKVGQKLKAVSILESALEIQYKHYGKNAPELIDTLVELGKSSFDEKNIRSSGRYFKKAIKIAGKADDPMLVATLNLGAGVFLSRRQIDSKAYFEQAYEIFDEQVGPADVRTGLAAFHLGRAALSRKKYEKAKNYLLLAVSAFAASDLQNRQFELTARGYLIHAYEELGQSDLATEHCQIIGRKSPTADNENYIPVFKKSPVYPAFELRNGRTGEVILEFVVDESGFTRNHIVVESTSDRFSRAALAAARQFRYAPRFENGEPVSTSGVQNKIAFDLYRQ